MTDNSNTTPDSKVKKHGKTGANYRINLRVETIDNTFGKVIEAIETCGGSVGAVNLVSSEDGKHAREIFVDCRNEAHQAEITDAVKKSGVTLKHWCDAVYDMHAGGKIDVTCKAPLDSRDALSMAYTPGVGRVCMTIAHDRERAFDLTIKQNTVAVVSDGTAVLGLGDIGPEAAMPVMEGKAMLFKEFGGVNAFPICLATKDVEEIIQAVKWLAPTFGGINL
ncbi:TPA: NAD-dependent malic enzyme, partial [Candidatus Sumerlaeota bacterium]|nr:NAD-dependent malic enzyme [Candidatus Sumerlaeota bacterium]